MTKYFEAKTNGGYTQITDDTFILYLASKQTLASYYVGDRKLKYAVNGGTYTERDVHIYSLPITDKIMYIGSPASGVAHVFSAHVCYVQKWNGYSPTSSLGKHNVLGIANVNKSVADAMVLYTFGQGGAPAGNVGLECYNENGNRVFTSGTPIMRVLYMNLFNHCAYDGTWNGTYKDLDVTHTYSGKDIAYNCCYSGFYNTHNSAHLPLCLLSAGKVQMTTITKCNWSEVVLNPDNYIEAVLFECLEGANQTAYSIIDVTNY